MKTIVFTFIFSIIVCCGGKKTSELILDVRSIVNKNAAEVELTIGKPDSTYTIRVLGKPIFCQLYKKHRIEIQYPENLATDIVVYEPHGLSFDQTALKAFNIDYKKNHPKEYMKDRLIRWFDVDEFSTISFYNPRFDSLGNIANFNIFFKAKPKE